VEDHILYFGPNAVNISGFAAAPAATAWPAVAGLVTMLGLAGAGLRRWRGD
jgi:LPXTG-motif cell wall-anchored protein